MLPAQSLWPLEMVSKTTRRKFTDRLQFVVRHVLTAVQRFISTADALNKYNGMRL
jgi:hypothetical protein